MNTKAFPPAIWTQAPAIAELDDAADCETIKEVFKLDRLDPSHPIALAWGNASAKSRRLLHQLAEDARLLRGVPGFGDLCKKIRTDVPGFEHAAYELRVAGSVARGPNQEVLRLGGAKAGPDIVFRAESGHECGVACYRALSATRDILDVKRLIDAMVQIFPTMRSAVDSSQNYCMRLLFPDFPMRWPEDKRAAVVILGHLWTQPQQPRYVSDRVEGSRLLLPESVFGHGVHGVRVRLEFPVSAWDQRRVLDAITDKIRHEAGWARDYTGVPLIAIEESDGAHGGTLRNDLRDVMASPNVFAGILLTHHPSDGLENIVWLPRQTGGLGLHVQVQTMWDSVQTYAGERPLVTLSSGTAFVDLDFRKGANGLEFSAGPFHSEWHSVRLPFMGRTLKEFANHPKYEAVIHRAMEVLRAQQARLDPRSPDEVIDIDWQFE